MILDFGAFAEIDGSSLWQQFTAQIIQSLVASKCEYVSSQTRG